MRTRMVALCGIMAGMAFLLSNVKLFTMPQGGSVTLVALPVLVVSLAAGPLYGLATGLLLGVMKIILAGHVYGIVQAVLDYPVAYSSLAIAGFASGPGLLPVVLFSAVALAMKFICHFISGYYFFSNSAWASLTYNASYAFPESAAALACLLLLYKKGMITVLKKMLGRVSLLR